MLAFDVNWVLTLCAIFFKKNGINSQHSDFMFVDQKIQYFNLKKIIQFLQKIHKKASMEQNKCTILCEFWHLEAADRLQSIDQGHFIFRINFENFHHTKSSALSNQAAHASNFVTCNNKKTQKSESIWLSFNEFAYIFKSSINEPLCIERMALP